MTPALPRGALADVAWLLAAGRHGAGHWLDNAAGRVETLQAEGWLLPLTLCEDGPQASYVANLVSGWWRYGVAEAGRALSGGPAPGRLALGLAAAGLAPLGAWLRLAGLHRAALLGNWLVSTNLHPPLSPEAWGRARDGALALAPDRPIALRSVCDGVHPGLPAGLAAAGWLLVPARLVYLCDPADPATWQHNHVRKDRRLLADPAVELVPPAELRPADLPALCRLFRQVFIAKHSALNPDFSDAFFRFCLDSGFLDLHALRVGQRLAGVLGIAQRHGWMTTPLIGYDTALPRNLALYRRLMALLLDQAREQAARLHYSSGAGSFKAARGGRPVLEHTALWVDHLPAPQRLAARALAGAMGRWAAPLLLRHG